MEAASVAEDNNPHRVRWYEFIIGAILFCLYIIIMIVLISDAASDLGINSPEFHLHCATMSLPNVFASEFTPAGHGLIRNRPQRKPRSLARDKAGAHPLFQTTKAQTTHRFGVGTVSAYVGDEVAREISEGRARGGVTFELQMLGWYRYTSSNTSPRMFEACYRVEFGFSPGNWTEELTRAGQSIACGIM
ncbi:unnamed protein product [Prunus armeniaca]|uniref:Uncharacterized protein n=1 Tax=Prunus armeniaca TaxID=36596 RepID=A0A6J5Y3B2_PRUAR|nr:unnamed protein product [Prunus armeniaca]